MIASIVTLDGELDTLREKIIKLEDELGYRLHYGDLRSKTRRVEAIEAIAGLNDWEGHLFESAVPIQSTGGGAEHHIRAKALKQAFIHLAGEGRVSRVVIETRNEPTAGFDQLDKADHQVHQRLLTRCQVPAGFLITHAGKDEPILSIADVLAGARTDLLCGKDDEIYHRVGHLVEGIHKVR